MGSEREYSLKLKPRDPNVSEDRLPKESAVIDRMIQVSAEKGRAVPFGDHWYRFFQQQRSEKILSDSSLSQDEKEIQLRIIEREAAGPGVYLDTFGRIYEEGIGGYFECSTLPCRDPFELLRRIRQGEQIAGFAARKAATDDFTVQCFNAGSDRHGIHSQSAGHHDNFWTWRENFNQIYREERGSEYQFTNRGIDFASLLVLRLPLTGAGRINPEHNGSSSSYEISERASFITHSMDSNTAHSRPLLNTRDEPHCSGARVHQINNDGNRSPWTILINLGLQALGLHALAHDGLILPWRLEDPVRALHQLSCDINLSEEIPIVRKRNGMIESKKPLELLLYVLRALERYTKISPLPSWCTFILGEALELTERMKMGDFDKASTTIDWLIKMKFLTDKKLRLGLDPEIPASWGHPKIRQIELSYHRLDDERTWLAVAEYCGVRDFEEYYAPFGDPKSPAFWESGVPTDTRAYLFWYLLHQPKLRSRVALSDWERIIFRENTDFPQIVIEIADLFRFNREHLELILKEGFDFTSPEGRLRFIKRLQEEGKPHEPSFLECRLAIVKRKAIRTPKDAQRSALEQQAEIAKRHRRLLPIVSQSIDDYRDLPLVREDETVESQDVEGFSKDQPDPDDPDRENHSLDDKPKPV